MSGGRTTVVPPASPSPRAPDLLSDDDESSTSNSGITAHGHGHGENHNGSQYNPDISDDDDDDDNDGGNDDSFHEENAARPRSPSSLASNPMARGDGPGRAGRARGHGHDRKVVAVAATPSRGPHKRRGGRRHSMDGGPSRTAMTVAATADRSPHKSSTGGNSRSTSRQAAAHVSEPQLIPASVTPSVLPSIIAVTNEDGHDTQTIEVGITTMTMSGPQSLSSRDGSGSGGANGGGHFDGIPLSPSSSSMSAMASSTAIASSSLRYQMPSRAPSEGRGVLTSADNLMVRPTQVAVVDTTENLFRLSGLTENRVNVDALLALHSDFLPYGVKMDKEAAAAAAATSSTTAATTTAGVTPLALSPGATPMVSHRGIINSHNHHHSPGTHVKFAEDHPFAPSSSSTVVTSGVSSTPPLSPQVISARRVEVGSRPSTGTGTGSGLSGMAITTTMMAASATASASDVLGNGHMSTTTNAILVTARSVKNFFSRSRSHSKVAPTPEQLAEQEMAAALRRKLTESAYYVDCAVRGISAQAESNSEANWRASKLHAQLIWMNRLVIALYMLLPFLQRPSWCLSTPCAHYYTNNSTSLPTNDLPLSNFPQLDLKQGLSMELACVMAITLHFVVHCTAVGWRSISRQWYFTVFFICASIAMVDIMITFLIMDRSWRLSQLMRPLLFITRSPTLRTELYTIIRTVPAVTEIFALIIVLLAIFAWLGLLLFYQTPETIVYMPNLWMAIQNLLILLTTANFPDIMMPIYNEHRLSALFFVIFIFIGLYFLMPLVLASIFNNYQVQQGIAADNIRAMKRQALTKAYRALHPNPDSDLPLSLDICQKLLRHIERRSAIQIGTTLAIDHEREKEILRKLDADGDGNVSVNEFMEFASLIKLRVNNDDQFTPFIINWFPSITFRARFEKLQRWTRHRRFHRLMIFIIVSHLILIITESAQVLSGNNVDNVGWFIAEWGYTAAYIAECLLKCLTSGWHRYWSRHHNKLAVLLTAANLAANILNANKPDLIRVVLLLRVARVLYVLDSVPQFEVIFSTFGKLVPQFSLVTGVLVATFYLWAEIGTLIFGGMVYESNPLLSSTQYAASGYWANSFNDFYSGLILLFELLVNNNWNILMDGFVAITSNWARAFFISFWVFVALIVMNLVSALILNTFVDEWSKAKEKVARRRAFLGTPSVSLDDHDTFTGTGNANAGTPAHMDQQLMSQSPTLAQQQWALQR